MLIIQTLSLSLIINQKIKPNPQTIRTVMTEVFSQLTFRERLQIQVQKKPVDEAEKNRILFKINIIDKK